MLDCLTRPWVLRLSRLEEVKDVLRARCRPESEAMVIRISEGSTAADRHAHPGGPIIRTAGISALAMLITYIAGRVLHPQNYR